MVRTAEMVASPDVAEVVPAVVMSSGDELHEEDPSTQDQGEKVEEPHGARTASIHATAKPGGTASRGDTVSPVEGAEVLPSSLLKTSAA
jgi:hypothetical protein